MMRGYYGSLIGLVILILDIIVVLDVLKSSMDTLKKILWILVIIAFPLLGVLLYYILEKKKITL